MWAIKLSLATAALPEDAEEIEVKVQNLNTIVIGICHIHLIITSIERNANGIRKLQVSTAAIPLRNWPSDVNL